MTQRQLLDDCASTNVRRLPDDCSETARPPSKTNARQRLAGPWWLSAPPFVLVSQSTGVRFAAACSRSLTASYLLHELFVASENVRPLFLSIIRWGCSSTKVTYPYQVVPFNLATQPLATQYVLPLIFKAAPDSSHCGIHDPSPFLSFYAGC